MTSVRRAVIDVGTNSVKLLVADVVGKEVLPVIEQSCQTRLGRGLYKFHRLQPEAIEATVEAIKTFSELATQHKAGALRVVATSAAREAVNASELTEAVERACHAQVEVISGEQEADWAFLGVTTDSRLAQTPVLLVEIGGGSTQFLLGRGDKQHFRGSYRLGTIRLLDKFPHSDPPTAKELSECRSYLLQFLHSNVVAALAPALRELTASQGERPIFVATGGTAAILARIEAGMEDYDRDRIEAIRLSRASLRGRAESLWGMRLEDRKQLPGLPANRADVILLGVLVYEAVLETFDFPELQVSTRGLRFAALLDATRPR